MSANLATRLLEHYFASARDLPWRAPPGAPRIDPYRVWLSEIMLQQTSVATVVPRFRRFVERWPTVTALAAADEAEVLREWAGLGYYARARNLIACARHVAELGAFPDSEAGLRVLPGVGDYTAAAIAAIAFGRPTAPVDVNIARVIARLQAIDRPLDQVRGEVRARMAELRPPERAGDFAQAMMDLGATICRPRAPRCNDCPMRGGCAAYASGTPEAFPPRPAKRERPQRFGIAWWTERGGALWLVRRPPSGLLGGMPALPGGAWSEHRSTTPRLATARHGFTHFTLDLDIVAREDSIGDGWWHPLDRIADAGLPTLYANAVTAVLDTRERLAA